MRNEDNIVEVRVTRHQRIDRLFEAADRLAAIPIPPLTEVEVREEVQAVRLRKRENL
jgi:hypothetical protein